MKLKFRKKVMGMVETQIYVKRILTRSDLFRDHESKYC